MVKFIFFSDGNEEKDNNTSLIFALLILLVFIVLVVILRDVYAELEPEPPTLSDEQNQMIRDYCLTGIRHPDMIVIPQCIAPPSGVGFYGLLEIYAIILSPILIIGILLAFLVLRKRK